MAYGQLNDTKNAILFFKRHIAYKDSLFNEESNKKAQQIGFDFLLGKKQNEITLLQKDKSLQNVENKQQRFLTLTSTLVACLVAIIAIVLFRGRQKEKKSKELILNQKTAIEGQAQILEGLNLLKDQTFSVLSHDLKSPIASLSSLMELLDKNVITHEEFDSMKSKLNHQLKVVNLLLDNLLHWSRSHIQNTELLPKKHFSAHPLAIQSVSLLKEMASRKNIEVVIEIPDSLCVYANRDQLDIVIRNLLSNAIKFTNLNGKITIRGEQKDNRTILSIEDNGLGMSPEYAAKLFGNTPSESRYGTKGEKGTGIGLQLCKEFIASNNGTITVTSKPGLGSTFYISLPIA